MDDESDAFDAGEAIPEEHIGIYVGSAVISSLVSALIRGKSPDDPFVKEFIGGLETMADQIATTNAEAAKAILTLVSLYRGLLRSEDG